MERFKYMKSLLPHVDNAFSAFYEEMLKDERIAVFFENKQQVLELIEKQKRHFEMTLDMSCAEIKASYIKLGEYHYDIRIPYIDFQKATELLEEYFLLHIEHLDESKDMMAEILEYFRMIRAYTAKGYLNRMLIEDKRDIDTFFEQMNEMGQTYFPKEIVLKKIGWLRDLIGAVESETVWENYDSTVLMHEWIDEIKDMPLSKRLFFEDMEQRIALNTNNLFYFLKRGEYQEILTLYSSLLTIYKLALMMNNALTLEYADKIIGEMRFDKLTGLFRKDIFSDLLSKEMAMADRHDEYYFSVAFIDIDDFKMINDNYGHYTGDKVLEELGKAVKKNIRASDLGIRIGGDELAIVLKHATVEDANKVCTKIHKEFGNIDFIFNDAISFKVTLSIGIQEYRGDKQYSYEEFMHSIDEQLYKAKSEGKNRIK